jgi:MEMO1 family protein
MSITEEEKNILVLLAAKAIAEKIDPGFISSPPIPELSENLQYRCGAFVSVYVDGELRGCIGTFSEEESLYINVGKMAVSAATEDSRFRSIQADELSRLELEISILTPRKRIFDPSEIIIGKHGIFLKRGLNRGTLLPQVAVKQEWTPEEFLGNCARYKAGIGWEGWKNAEIYTYEAIVFRSGMPLL